jgi:two-component system, cell cycle sensor histidine kinase and response regulator CckA
MDDPDESCATAHIDMKSAFQDPQPDHTLRLLLVEDNDDDEALILRAIGAAGFQPTTCRARTEAEYQAALASGPWDVVVSDYALPRFNAMGALRCLHEQQLDFPFIVVSGTIDEESAVTILKAGAHDFVTKQNLARLGPAIRRELQDARDRSARREAQLDLKVQRDMLRLVIDTNPSLIALKDGTGRFILANRAVADLYGTTVADLIGRGVDRFSPVDDEAARSLAAHHEVLRTGQPRFDESEPLTDVRTGALRWFETRSVPLVLPDGARQVLWIATDITDRRTAQETLRVTEEQFRQAQKMEAVGQLAGGIAHDFNNLLTAILGYSELVLEQIGSDSELAPDLHEIRKAGERARGLTAQLLAVGRKQLLQPQILDLNAVVSEVEGMLRRVISEDIQFEIAVDQRLSRVHADPGQIHQVLMNLAINARDAMPRGGTLRITTGNTLASVGEPSLGEPPSQQRCVALTISDTGCGMSPEVRARIFEPFFTTKAPGKGTGLGLSMVYGVVAESGGRISVESERDRGTTFTIHLPAIDNEATSQPASVVANRRLQGTETILLVEDERPIRELVRKVLARYGYDVLEASDVTHALEIAKHHPAPIHLLLSDIVMPQLSGPDLAQRIVRHRRDVRVLYMSGFSNRLGTGVGALSGGVAMLEKPFTPERLAITVRECLSR